MAGDWRTKLEMTNQCGCEEFALDLRTLRITCKCDIYQILMPPKQKIRTEKQDKPFTDPVFEELRNQIED